MTDIEERLTSALRYRADNSAVGSRAMVEEFATVASSPARPDSSRRVRQRPRQIAFAVGFVAALAGLVVAAASWRDGPRPVRPAGILDTVADAPVTLAGIPESPSTTTSTSHVSSSQDLPVSTSVPAEPGSDVWVRDNFYDLAVLQAAIDSVRFYTARGDAAGMMSGGDLGCTAPATALAESGVGVLDRDQIDAFHQITDLCTSMAAMFTAGDVAGVTEARPMLEAAIIKIQALLTAVETLLITGDSNEPEGD